jgi:hypothetical protein
MSPAALKLILPLALKVLARLSAIWLLLLLIVGGFGYGKLGLPIICIGEFIPIPFRNNSYRSIQWLTRSEPVVVVEFAAIS